MNKTPRFLDEYRKYIIRELKDRQKDTTLYTEGQRMEEVIRNANKAVDQYHYGYITLEEAMTTLNRIQRLENI